MNLNTLLPNMELTHDVAVMGKFYSGELNTREGILNLQRIIEADDNSLGKDPFPLFHSFADGMYTREVHIPKGYFVVGQIHRKEYFVNFLKGRLLVASEFGSKELIAPCSFTAPAGVKHVVYSLEDSVWSDTHKVSTTNILDAEKEIFAESYSDYDNVIEQIGFSEEQVTNMLEDISDLIEQPESEQIEIKDSDIQGVGVFTTSDVKKDEVIATARVGLNRTPVGRYTNHSGDNNAICKISGNKIMFIALKDIDNGTEITVDYRDVVSSAKSLDGELT